MRSNTNAHERESLRAVDTLRDPPPFPPPSLAIDLTDYADLGVSAEGCAEGFDAVSDDRDGDSGAVFDPDFGGAAQVGAAVDERAAADLVGSGGGRARLRPLGKPLAGLVERRARRQRGAFASGHQARDRRE